MIHVDVPGALVEGEIYTPDDDLLLLEDGMLHVLVAGFSIDVSWHPEHDPSGEYVITVYEDVWERQVNSTTARSGAEAAGLVELVASLLSDRVTNLPLAESTVEEEYVYRRVG